MDAQVLLASMQSAPHVSARSGWLVLLQSLLRKGYHQKVCTLASVNPATNLQQATLHEHTSVLLL